MSLTLTSSDFVDMIIAVISFLSTSLLRVMNLKSCKSAWNIGYSEFVIWSPTLGT